MERNVAEPQPPNNQPVDAARTRVVLFGMRCTMTRLVLDALAGASAIDLAAVVLPRNEASRSQASPDPVQIIVRKTHAALVEIPDRPHLSMQEFRTTLEKTAPDVVIVACSPWRLPRWVLTLPPGGCVNVHPSLLPDGRGPEPIFWAFRWGLEETGVTLHLMDEGFDTGPVLSQRRCEIPQCATIPDLERSLAKLGAGMVLEHISTPPDGRTAPSPQRNEDARYAPIPQREDLIVPTSWPARHAARFIRAVVPVYGPLPVLVLATGQRLMVDKVIRRNAPDAITEPIIVDGDTARIRFADDVLACRIAHDRQPLRLS